MGTHVWLEQCQYCGLEEMLVCTTDNLNFEIACQICGYKRWTEEKFPSNIDIEQAKQALSKMDVKEKQRITELYFVDSIPLIDRLKDRFRNEE